MASPPPSRSDWTKIMAHFTKYKKKDGTTVHRVRVVTGYQRDGKPVQESRSYPTATEAKRAVKAWETEIAQGTSGATAKTALRDYLAEWLARKARTARPITVASYGWLIKHTIADTAMAATMLGKVTPGMVQKWIDGMPHAATARKARAMLNIALNEATRLGHIAVNPVARTTPPSHIPREGRAWTIDQVHRFLKVAETDGYAPFWQIACYLGMRPSEIAGLRWASRDLDEGTLTVERARPTYGGKTYRSESTKSASGKRVLALPAPLVRALATREERQRVLRTLAGGQWVDSGLVCTNEVGTAIDHRNIQRRFRRLCDGVKLPRIRVYDLRHTAASLMIDAGADLKAASEALGHSDLRITMKIHRHVRGDQRARAIGLLADAITAPPGEPEGDRSLTKQ